MPSDDRASRKRSRQTGTSQSGSRPSGKGPARSTSREERLGEFEQLALLAVLRLGDEAHGATIQRELEATAGRDASISAIYITLTRMEKKGLVSSWLGEPEEVRGGKARRYFRVEPAGAEALSRSRDQLMRMWNGVEGDLVELGGAGVD